MGEDDPEAIHRKVMDAFNARDVDALVALYEPGATMVTVGGVATGLDEIRANWEELVGYGATMQLTTRFCLVNGDLALLRNDYLLTSPEFEYGGATSEVARRQGDGTWRYVIDHPFGAGELDGP